MMTIEYRKAALAAMLALAPLPAHAAEWWLLPGASTATSALFADSDGMMRGEEGVSLHILRIDRSGGAVESTHWTRCDATRTGDEEALRRFACGSHEERMGSAMMLGTMAPEEAARLIFTVKDPRPGS